MTEQGQLQHLYVDEDGRGISTHSMIKTFRRCPKQCQYKYFERLKPRQTGRPLREGTWMHLLQQRHYEGGDWEAEHKKQTAKFNKLFDEEQTALGDLPTDCHRAMKSYLWHYKHHKWKIHEVEFVLETTFPDGRLYRAKIDLLAEDQYGLWIVDHKWNRTLPNLDFRILDSQSALYVWAALRSGLPVQGHIWNYGLRKAPSIPALLKDGSRLSRARIDTDYPTFKQAIKSYGLDPADYADQLAALKRRQYRMGEPQMNPFFRRDVMEKSNAMVKEVAQEAHRTSKRMHDYDFTAPGVERAVDRSCTYMCSYVDLCTMELMGGGIPDNIRRQRYEKVDPMYYYDDDPKGDDRGQG